MFKRIVRAVLLGCAIFTVGAISVYAWLVPTWQKPICNEMALTKNTTYSFQTNNAHVDTLSFQCEYGSTTIANFSFTDGRQSTGTIVVSSSPFPVPTAIANALVCINGTCVVGGTDWQWDAGAKTTGTATSIMTALNTKFAGVIVSTTGSNTSTIWSTSTAVGVSTNYSMWSSTQAALTVGVLVASSPSAGWGSGTFVGGANMDYNYNTGDVVKTGNPYWPAGNDPNITPATGFQVLYTTSSGVGITGLTWGTTYFVVPVSANDFKLATTSTGAFAGAFVTLASSSPATTTHTFNLASPNITGTPTLTWQWSNDGVNFTNVSSTRYGQSLTSVSMGSYVFPSTTTLWDFGEYDYTWIRMNAVAPTAGGIKLKCTPNGEGQVNGQ